MTARTYQRRIQKLTDLVRQMQWVQPTYNGNPSCANCGAQKHFGCQAGCEAAAITGDSGERPHAQKTP
jgi:hypothetical protein